MKRNILSVLLACLMIVSLCLMVGCNNDELKAQIQENDAKQEGAVSDLAADLESDIKSAADTAAANLAEAQKKLEAMISSGDAVDAAALKAATAEFNAALAAAQDALNATIDAAVEDATNAYAALEASLEKAIKDATDAVAAAADKKISDLDAALKDAIAAGDAVLSTKVGAIAEELAALQDSVLTDMVALDLLVKQELTAKFDAALEALYEDLYYYIDALATDLEDAVATLEAADAANKKAAEDALAAAIADYTTKIDALNTALSTLDAKVDANKKALEDAIAALETSLTKALTDAVAKLEAADAANKAAAEKAVADAIADYTAKINALNTALSTLDAKVDANKKALEDAIAALETSLTKALTDAVAALEKADADNKAAAEKALADAIADYTAKINALNTALETLEDKVDANKKALEDAITALETSLTKALTDAVAALEKADADNKKAAEDALVAEVTRIDALISGLDTRLTAVETLAAANKTAIETLATKVAEDLAAAVKKLEDADAADKQAVLDEIDSEIARVEGIITTLETKVDTNNTTLTDAVAALKTDLEDKIDAVNERVDVIINEWNGGTTAAIDAILTINSTYKALAATIDPSAIGAIENFYEVTKVKVLRALSATEVKAITDEYVDVMSKLTGVAAVYNTIEFALYYAPEQAEINDFFAVAVNAIIASTTSDTPVDIAAIEAKFATDVAAVNTKTDLILAIFDTLGGADVDNVEFVTEWYDAINDAKNAISAESDPVVLTNVDFADMVVLVDALYDRYVQLTGYADGVALADRIEAVLAGSVVYNDTVLEAEVAAIRAAFDLWVADALNATLVNEIFVDDMLTKFAAVEARIIELDNALAAADLINARIEALIANINISTVSNANKAELAQLAADIAAWATTYNVDSADTANYNMVNHNRMTDAQTAWDVVYAAFKTEALPYIEAVNAIPDVLDILSGDEINAAIDYYDAMKTKLGKYDQVFLDDPDIGKTPFALYNELLTKKVAFDALVAEANTAFDSAYLTVKDYMDGTTPVTMYTTDLSVMFTWFATYGVWDVDTLVFDVSGKYDVITGATVDATFYATLAGLQEDIDELVAAKNAETDALKALINAIGAVALKEDINGNKLDGDSLDAIVKAENALVAWKNGTARPDGFDAAQFTPDPVNYPALFVLDAAYETTLTAARAKYDSLVAAAQVVRDYIANDVDDNEYTYDIADVTARDAYQATITEAYAKIAAFNTLNADGSVAFDVEKLEIGELAIARFNALYTIETYFVAIDPVVDVVLNDIVSDSEDAINDAEEFDDIIALAKAKYDAIKIITVEYLADYANVYGDYDAEYALDEIFDVAIEAIYDATTVDGADDYNAIASAKFDVVVDAYNTYVAESAVIDALLTGSEKTDVLAEYEDVYAETLSEIVDADEATYDFNDIAEAIYDNVEALATKYVAALGVVSEATAVAALSDIFYDALDAIVACTDGANALAEAKFVAVIALADDYATTVAASVLTGDALDAAKVALADLYEDAMDAVVDAADADEANAAVIAVTNTFDKVLAIEPAYNDAIAAIEAIVALATEDKNTAKAAILAIYKANLAAVVADTDANALAVAKYADIEAVAIAYVAAIADVQAALETNYAAKYTVALASLKTVYEANVETVEDNDTYALDYTAKFDALVEVAEKYAAADAALQVTLADPAFSAQLTKLQAIISGAFDAAQAIKAADADVATLLATANDVFTAANNVAEKYVAAVAKVESVKDVYTNAKVYDMAKAALDAAATIFDEVDATAAELNFAADKFAAIVYAIDLFEDEYAVITVEQRPVLELAFERAIPNITAETVNMDRVIDLIDTELQSVRLG